MSLRQAAQQALEALVTCCAEEWRTLNNFGMRQVYDEKKVNAAIAALHAALAEPDSDYERGFVDGMNLQTKGSVDKAVNRMAQTTHWEGCEAVHPECRKQEPVAWRYRGNLHEFDPSDWAEGPVTPLYTAPTPRKPLTDEEIWNTYKNLWMFHHAEEPRLAGDVLKFARAIERAHGICK